MAAERLLPHNLDAALRYAARGWHVLPVRAGSKVPLTTHGVKDATTDQATIREWWAKWPSAGVAIATGSRSGLVVVDVDGREGERSLAALKAQHANLPTTREARTPRGGRHLYFGLPHGEIVRCSAGKLGPGLDVRGEGGYVVAPPSRHENGRAYQWANQLDPAPLPDWLGALVCESSKNERAATPPHGDAPKIRKGERNATLTSLAGSMCRRGMSYQAIEAALLAENATRCEPPLPEAEVRKIAGSVVRYAPAPKPRKTVGVAEAQPEPEDAGKCSGGETQSKDRSATISVDSDLENDIREVALDEEMPLFDKRRAITKLLRGELKRQGQFFHTNDGRGLFFHNNERQLYDVEQSQFERLLVCMSGLSLTENFFKFALDLIQTEVLRNSPLTEVQTLAFFDPDSGLLAISDSGPGIWIRERGGQWQQIRNGDSGFFFLTDGDSTMWAPEFGDAEAERWWLDGFLFAADGLSVDDSKTAILIWLEQQFFPSLRRTRITPCFLGPQGSGKTTAMRLIGRLLVGPSFDVTGIRADKEDAFIAAVTNRTVLGLDNADSRIPYLPDSLATYATGQRYRLRKLYTTNEEAAYVPRAILLVSSRDPRFNRPDVSDRLLALHFERPEKYRSEDQIFGELEKRRGEIMGALLLHLGTIADALQTTSPKPLPFRMADYASFGERVFAARGESEKFISLLKRLEQKQAEFASEGDGLVEALRILLDLEEIQDMPISDLYHKCVKTAQEHNLLLARTLQGFGRHFSNMRRILEMELGVRISELRGQHSKRVITFVKLKGKSKEAEG